MKSKDSSRDELDHSEELQLLDEMIHILRQLKKSPESVNGISLKLLLENLKSVAEYNALFNQGVSDPDNFLSLSDIEGLTLNLQDRLNSFARDLTQEKMRDIDQKSLCKKKRTN